MIIVDAVKALLIEKGKCRVFILGFADNARKSLARNPTFMEVAGWTLKLALAEKYQSGLELTESEKYRVGTEIEFRGRGETIESLTAKVIKQSGDLAIAVSVIDGIQSASLRACENCTTLEEVSALCEKLTIEASEQLNKLKGI